MAAILDSADSIDMPLERLVLWVRNITETLSILPIRLSPSIGALPNTPPTLQRVSIRSRCLKRANPGLASVSKRQKTDGMGIFEQTKRLSLKDGITVNYGKSVNVKVRDKKSALARVQSDSVSKFSNLYRRYLLQRHRKIRQYRDTLSGYELPRHVL